MKPSLTCSRCNRKHQRKGQRYCASCHAAAQRRYRKRLKRERDAVARFISRAAPFRRNVSRVTNRNAA